MQVSIDAILNKMAKELALAQQTKQDIQKIREHVMAIRTLCDLVLEEQKEARPAQPQFAPQAIAPASIKLPYFEEDDANGDSLLDF
ncbi:MAG: YwdI family protein [Ectobacillus sp.]